MTSRFIEELKIEQKRIQRLISISSKNQGSRLGSLYLARRGNRFNERYEEVKAWVNAPYEKNPHPFPDAENFAKDGTFIIIEHLGKLGNLGYAIDFGERCHWFLKEDFILGKNFFVTSDDKNYGTDSAMIAELVGRIERMFYGY